MENSYDLHTSVSGFNLILLSIIFDIKTYGAVDYRVLYENDISLMYLTKSGWKQAYDLSKKLVNDRFFEKIINDSKELNYSLKNFKIPKLNKKNVSEKWEEYLKLLNEFCRLYRFYEQPFQQVLEEIVLKHISEDELVKKLSDSNKEFLKEIKNNELKKSLEKLIKLGEMKLKLHHNAENLVTTDIKSFVNFAAKEYILSINTINLLTVKEFTIILKGKNINTDITRERSKGCAIVKRNNKWYFESGNKYLYWKNKIKDKNEKISGKTAYPGRIKGKVVIHQSWTDTTKLNKGEILVTGMTNPQMIPFIRKAAAIVTDEGGITCHAAIISREMKIPCITATKNATQVLKTGDFIEVNADKGIVEIIKQKETGQTK